MKSSSPLFHPLIWATGIYLVYRAGVWLNRFGGMTDLAGVWLVWTAVAAGAVLSITAVIIVPGDGGKRPLSRFAPLLAWAAVMAELFIFRP